MIQIAFINQMYEKSYKANIQGARRLCSFALEKI